MAGSPQLPVWVVNWTHRVRFPPLYIGWEKSQPREWVLKTKTSFFILLLLGWSKQESRKAFLSTKTFLYPSSSKRCIRRPRQRGELSLPHSFPFLFSTTDHPYVFCILTLSYCYECLPSLLDLSRCHSIMCPYLLHRGVGLGYAVGNQSFTNWFCSDTKCWAARAWNQGQDAPFP